MNGFHGVMVSTLDSESSDPSSNLGGTLAKLFEIVTVGRENKAYYEISILLNTIFHLKRLAKSELKVAKYNYN